MSGVANRVLVKLAGLAGAALVLGGSTSCATGSQSSVGASTPTTHRSVSPTVGPVTSSTTPARPGARRRHDPPLRKVPYPHLPVHLDQFRLGAETTLPWWQGGRLHVGGHVIATGLRRILSRGGTTVVGHGWRRWGGITTWRVVVGGRLQRLPLSHRAGELVMSADGRWIVWLDDHERTTAPDVFDVHYRLVVYDARSHRMVADLRDRRTVRQRHPEGRLELFSVDNHGTVAFEWAKLGPYVWARDDRPRPLTMGTPRALADQTDGWPGGVTLAPGASAGSPARQLSSGVYGTVSAGGRFHEVGGVRGRYDAWWSPDGSAVLRAQAPRPYGRVRFWADRIRAGRSVRLGSPPYSADAANFTPVGWESDRSVILWKYALPGTLGLRVPTGGVSQLIRCDAVTGDCERVANGPQAGTSASMPTLSSD